MPRTHFHIDKQYVRFDGVEIVLFLERPTFVGMRAATNQTVYFDDARFIHFRTLFHTLPRLNSGIGGRVGRSRATK